MSENQESRRGKLIIEFDPDQYREVEETRKILTNHKWANAMNELDQYLRNLLKYGLNEASLETYDEVQKVRDKLWECLNDQGISFDNDL